MADEVLVARPHADAALAAAALVAIRRDGRPLDVAGAADRDRHVLFGDQILDVDLAGFAFEELRPAIVAVLRADFLQLVDDDLHEQALAREDRAQTLDRLQQLGQLVEDLLALEARQALELHVENRLRLDLRQAELHHQAVARFGHGLRRANQRDHLVEMIERDPQAFEDVVARLGLAQLELGPAPDDLAPELDEALDELQQAEHLRPAADDGQHDDAEARLQRRVLVEVVEDDLRHFAALELDDDPHAFAVGFVAKVGDALDGLLADQIGDALDQLRLVDLIRNFGEDDRRRGRPSCSSRSSIARAS